MGQCVFGDGVQVVLAERTDDLMVLKQAQADPSQAALRRFLGVDGGLGSKLGLPDDFVVQVIRATGHYGEIYDRHLGRDSAVTIPRSVNRLAGDGGLMVAPPFS